MIQFAALLAFFLCPALHAAIANADEAWQHVAFGFVNDEGAFAIESDKRGPNFDPQDIRVLVRDGATSPMTIKTNEEDQSKFLAAEKDRNVSGMAAPKVIVERHELFALRKLSAPACSEKLMKELRKIGGRKVARCQATHEFGKTGRTGFVVFEKQGTSLAGFFVADARHVAFEPHETAPGQGWREGDGGVFAAETLDMLWAFKRKKDGALGVAYTWGLGEGTHTVVAVAKGTSLSRVFNHYEFNSGGL